MAISKEIWRFQCDPNGESDPVVQVFLKETVTVDGRTFENRNDVPVLMKLSELVGGLPDLLNAEKVAMRKQDRK